MSGKGATATIRMKRLVQLRMSPLGTTNNIRPNKVRKKASRVADGQQQRRLQLKPTLLLEGATASASRRTAKNVPSSSHKPPKGNLACEKLEQCNWQERAAVLAQEPHSVANPETKWREGTRCMAGHHLQRVVWAASLQKPSKSALLAGLRKGLITFLVGRSTVF